MWKTWDIQTEGIQVNNEMIKIKYIVPSNDIEEQIRKYCDEKVVDGERHILLLRRGVLGEKVACLCNDEYYESTYRKRADEYYETQAMPTRCVNENDTTYRERFVRSAMYKIAEWSRNYNLGYKEVQS